MRPAADAASLAAAVFTGAVQRIRRLRRPAATYRVQLHAGFPFDRAVELAPYLARLGVTDLYTSPYLRAGPGSAHGYDVVDHGAVNPELGGEEGLGRLVSALAAHGLSHVLDFVPNHMGIGAGNAWWQDVLENGPSSVFARFFDIDWKPVKDELEDKVLVPVLGDQYGAVLEAGELRLELAGGTFQVRTYDQVFPVNPRHYPLVLRHRLDELVGQIGKDDLRLEELLSICTACDNLPLRTETDPERIEQRRREKEVVKRRLQALRDASPEIAEFLRRNVDEFNGRPGDPRSFDLLDQLLEQQAYRLAHWRVAGEEINYRRFFDINALAAIRMEDPVVFAAAHRLVLRLVGEGKIHGLRIDHPDGLYEPREYFRRLQEEQFIAVCREVLAERSSDLPFDALEPLFREAFARDARGPSAPLFRLHYVVAEKILGRGEQVPDSWAVDGTTGYEFLNTVGGLFVDPSAARALDDIYARWTGQRIDFRELLYEKKKLILSTSMASEIGVLASQLNRISEHNRRTRDFTLNSLRSALVEYIACFPVYRTYVSAAGADARDRRYVELAVARAKRRNPTTSASTYDFLRDVLLAQPAPEDGPAEQHDKLGFAMRVQQVTAPVTAKGLEDTAFYVYNRLVSLNEVGGEPAIFGRSVAEFHELNAERLARHPGSLATTSTHDTKRSEDVRARIHVISELPDEWRALLRRLGKVVPHHRTTLADERVAPDRNEQWLLFQTLLGVWPLERPPPAEWDRFADRIDAFALKAAREAKVNTSWVNPDPVWEEALSGFVRGVLHDPAFVDALAGFARRVAEPALHGSLAQLVLKIASPGVPDIYQGNELWDLSLVDPDNRRPVDLALRDRLLAELEARAAPGGRALEALARELWAVRADGRVKLYVTWRALQARRTRQALFLSGEYVPLRFAGPRAAHAVGLSRRRGFSQAVAVVPRLVARLLDERAAGHDPWTGTHLLLPAGSGRTPWIDVFTGIVHRPELHRGDQALPLADLFEVLPVALLVPAS